ncbi:MAG: ECF transporter S component [Oscillospiraceae bacterium]|nr:ECF transporter S component [Oscillospiraceae bacterium]
MNSTKKLVTSALMLSLALVLPFFTGQIPEIGNMLLPMHIPVLLAGFLVGGPSAMAVGFIAPILRSAIWGMPMLFPKAIGMAFELAAYGLVCGTIYSKSKKDTKAIFTSLIIAMIFGRIVWGVVSLALYGIMGNVFTIAIFATEAFANAIPGIVVQLILIPVLVAALKKAKIAL